MVINEIYRIAKQTKGSSALQKACLRALTAKPSSMKRRANTGNPDSQLQALMELPADEQKEVKVGVLSEIVNKVKAKYQSIIDAGTLDTFKELVKETGIANKIRRGEKIITAPSNQLEKKISEKAKSFANVSDSIAFLGRLTQAESPEEIVKALDISMDEFESYLSVILGKTVTGLIGGGWRKFYSAIAEIKEVYKLFTVELAMTILEISTPSILFVIFGNATAMDIIHGIGHAFHEVFSIVVLGVLFIDLKDTAQFIRKFDIISKGLPIAVANDLIRALKWSWTKVTSFFSKIVTDTVDFFAKWFDNVNDDKVAVFNETLRLASINPVFHQRVLEVLA